MAVHSWRGSDPTAHEDSELARLTFRDEEGGSSGEGGGGAMPTREGIEKTTKKELQGKVNTPSQRNESGRGTLGRGLRLARSLGCRVERCASLCRCAFWCTVMGKQKKNEKRESRYASVKMEKK